MNRIDRFRGEYRFLSNFWIADVYIEGYWYPSVEHAYQAMKTLDEQKRKVIRAIDTCANAKRLGNKIALRGDWDLVRIQYMRHLVWQKFSLHQELKVKLLATGTAELVEGNTWNDTFWGVCNGIGQNWLGKTLMDVRTVIGRPQ